ncbi:hypothetical protein [Frankia sp. R82]|uniref:hypothetical protein n=1 Tax=Frankia sp. R82 TaxID=2950553 RepID=UPI002043A583|nr:hypothetical protein [Frankia sp. R82]MCM3887461.1 hypothetical protein [Frankia sp. R82]
MARELETIDLDRLILAVPMITTPLPAVEEDARSFRSPSTGPLREDLDEQNVIVYTTYDVEEGVSCGMVPYSHNPDGTYTFGLDDDPTQIVTIKISPSRTFPRMALLREILDDSLGLRRADASGADTDAS